MFMKGNMLSCDLHWLSLLKTDQVTYCRLSLKKCLNSKIPSGAGAGKGRLLSDKFFLLIPDCDLHVTTAGSKATCGFGTGELPVELSSLLVFHTKNASSQEQAPP